MFIPFSKYGIFEKDLFHFNILPLYNAAQYLEDVFKKNNRFSNEYLSLLQQIDDSLDKYNEYYNKIENGVM